MKKTLAISFKDFITKTEDLEHFLNSYVYGGYSEKQWEQKPIVDSLRKTEIHTMLREIKAYIENDAIDYTNVNLLEDDYYDLTERLSTLLKRAEDYIYEN